MSHESLIPGRSPPAQFHHEDIANSRYSHPSVPAYADQGYATPASYDYGDPEDYAVHQTHEYYDQPTFYREGTFRTPPQPISNDGMHTRSGRSLGTPTTSSSPSSRMSNSPRPKRNRKGKNKQLEYNISEPLSTMTKDYDVPVEDMMTWVNRSAEERYTELDAKHKGKVPRPMNSFMLYRRAFKERIKKWGAQGDNNQLISSVAGISWNLESAKLKDFYAKIANIERDNHAAAFPTYKFAPNKSGKKRDRDADADDSDADWEGGSSYSSKRRRGRFDRDVTRSRSTTPAHIMYGESPQYHASSYQASNPHPHMMPPQYDQWAQPAQYGQCYPYEQVTYHHPLQSMQYGPTSVPSQRQYVSQLVGMPPASENMLVSEAVPQPEFAIDPGLGEFTTSANYHYGSFPEAHREHGLHTSQLIYEQEAESVIHPGMQTLVPAEQVWSPTGTGHAGGAFDAELSRWSGEH